MVSMYNNLNDSSKFVCYILCDELMTKSLPLCPTESFRLPFSLLKWTTMSSFRSRDFSLLRFQNTWKIVLHIPGISQWTVKTYEVRDEILLEKVEAYLHRFACMFTRTSVSMADQHLEVLVWKDPPGAKVHCKPSRSPVWCIEKALQRVHISNASGRLPLWTWFHDWLFPSQRDTSRQHHEIASMLKRLRCTVCFCSLTSWYLTFSKMICLGAIWFMCFCLLSARYIQLRNLLMQEREFLTDPAKLSVEYRTGKALCIYRLPSYGLYASVDEDWKLGLEMKD